MPDTGDAKLLHTISRCSGSLPTYLRGGRQGREEEGREEEGRGGGDKGGKRRGGEERGDEVR